MNCFDFDRAYSNLATVLANDRIRVHHYQTHPNGNVIRVQIGQGASRCAGGLIIQQNPKLGLITIRSGMSYKLRLEDPDVRKCLSAIWDEVDRQGCLIKSNFEVEWDEWWTGLSEAEQQELNSQSRAAAKLVPFPAS